MPLKKRDQRMAAFACDLDLLEWRLVQVKKCNASATFQRSKSLGHFKRPSNDLETGKVVMAYIDDDVIPTVTIEDDIVGITEVFQSLREAGFERRAENCDFTHTKTKYLGRDVSAGGIRTYAAVAVIKSRT